MISLAGCHFTPEDRPDHRIVAPCDDGRPVEGGKPFEGGEPYLGEGGTGQPMGEGGGEDLRSGGLQSRPG